MLWAPALFVQQEANQTVFARMKDRDPTATDVVKHQFYEDARRLELGGGLVKVYFIK